MSSIKPLPDGRTEVLRHANVGDRGFTVACPVCKREVFLLFNGGELDRRDCCGHEFQLVHARIDAVIYKMPTDTSKEFLSKKQPFETSAT